MSLVLCMCMIFSVASFYILYFRNKVFGVTEQYTDQSHILSCCVYPISNTYGKNKNSGKKIMWASHRIFLTSGGWHKKWSKTSPITTNYASATPVSFILLLFLFFAFICFYLLLFLMCRMFDKFSSEDKAVLEGCALKSYEEYIIY